jgi:hypothetical protein
MIYYVYRVQWKYLVVFEINDTFGGVSLNYANIGFLWSTQIIDATTNFFNLWSSGL